MSADAAEVLQRTNFTLLDWGIVAAYLSISVFIGIWVNRYMHSMTAYVTAGRSLGTCLGIATMTGTELGLITVMYAAQKGFVGGFAAFHIAIIAGLVTFFVGVTGFIVADLRRHRVLTIPEFYEQRFSRGVRVLGGCMLAFGGILNMGLFLKVGSMFITGVTGLASEGWALPVVMTTLLTLVLVYTVLGGMVSVVLTDYIQFVVLSFGLVATTILAIVKLGWDNIFEVVAREQGRAGFDPLMEGEFGPEYVAWMAVLGLVGCAIWPTAVARALAMESTASVKRQYRWSSLSFMIRFLIPYFWGICAFVFITQATELRPLFFPELECAEPELNDLYAMPVFLGRLLPAGLIGLISAAMIAAFMSTHDSYLLCWSSVITQDVVAPLRKRELGTRARILLTRVLIVVIGLYVLGWGLFYEGSDDVWDYMAVTGAIFFTGAFALLVGGLYWRRASTAGAYAGLLAGSSAVLGLEPLRKPLEVFLRTQTGMEELSLSGARVGLFSVALTVVVFVLVSLVWPGRNTTEESTTKDTELTKEE